VEVNDAGLALYGVVRTEQEQNQLVQRAGALVRGLPVDNRIRVQPNEAEALAETPGPEVLPEFPSLYFMPDSTELVTASRPILTEVVSLMRRYPALTLEAAGHTDSAGEPEYNQALSVRRANDFIDLLVAAGIERERLIPVGFGERQPIAENTTASGRALNRRIELKVLN
jgi:outer membrane protein OmpA-like peptidoglycan-associated protein